MLLEVIFLAHICFSVQAQFLVIQSLKPSEKKKNNLIYCLSSHAISSVSSLLFFSGFSSMTLHIKFGCRLKYQNVPTFRCFTFHSSRERPQWRSLENVLTCPDTTFRTFGQLYHSPASTDSRLHWLDWTSGTFSPTWRGLNSSTWDCILYILRRTLYHNLQCFTSLLT